MYVKDNLNNSWIFSADINYSNTYLLLQEHLAKLMTKNVDPKTIVYHTDRNHIIQTKTLVQTKTNDSRCTYYRWVIAHDMYHLQW